MMTFNERQRVRAALVRLEARHKPLNEVIEVHVHHYFVRRSRTGTAVPIRFSVRGDRVEARDDVEEIKP